MNGHAQWIREESRRLVRTRQWIEEQFGLSRSEARDTMRLMLEHYNLNGHTNFVDVSLDSNYKRHILTKGMLLWPTRRPEPPSFEDAIDAKIENVRFEVLRVDDNLFHTGFASIINDLIILRVKTEG